MGAGGVGHARARCRDDLRTLAVNSGSSGTCDQRVRISKSSRLDPYRSSKLVMRRRDRRSLNWTARARRHPCAHDHRNLESPHPVGCYLPVIEPENQVVSPRCWYLNVRNRYPEWNESGLTELCLRADSRTKSGLDAYW
jgi:hypothetical protein